MNVNSIQIDLNELRAAVATVLDHIESVGGSTVTLPVDYFWSVPAPGIFEVEHRPAELTIGQVSESWDNLTRERAGDGRATVGFASVWLGEVLAAVGHNVAP